MHDELKKDMRLLSLLIVLVFGIVYLVKQYNPFLLVGVYDTMLEITVIIIALTAAVHIPFERFYKKIRRR